MMGIILHGGYGTRLRPLTHTGPKQLIPVANKPISQYVLEDLTEAGINEIAIVLGNTYPEKVKEHYGDGSTFGAKLSYVYQGLSVQVNGLAALLPPTVHGKKLWLFTKIGHFTRQIAALKKRHDKHEDILRGFEARLTRCQVAIKDLEDAIRRAEHSS